MESVRDFLTEYNQKKGWGLDEDTLIESMTEGKTVWKGDLDEHRWYIIQQVVVDIEGTFIRFFDYIITGDNSMSDMDLEYDLNEAEIVERKERQITEVYYE